MTLLVVGLGPTPKLKPTIPKCVIADWDSFLYSYWLLKIALDPGFYDDVKKSHSLGHCKCSCTGFDVLEIRKNKK